MKHDRMGGLGLVALGLVACGNQANSGPIVASPPPPASRAAAAESVPRCGFENDRACAPRDEGARCDTGLALDRNGTPFDPDDDRCVNDTRHLAGPPFRGSWVDWALANQRTLAIDEPINWVMHLSTHNAYNNGADGYVLDPNQVWSLSDQLDLGSRFLWLDLQWRRDAVRLCHSVLCGTGDRKFAYGIQEIDAWLAANPDEIVLIDLEAYVDGHFDEVAAPLDAFFGDELYRKSDRAGPSWPSRRELLQAGKRVVIGARGSDADLGDDFRGTIHRNYLNGRLDVRYVRNFEVATTDGIVTSCGGRRVDDDGGLEPLGINDDQFWVVGEDRTLIGLVVGTGYVEADDVRNLVACNVPLLSLDLLSFSRCATVPACIELGDVFQRTPEEERQPHAVWSWREGDRGAAGDAALLHGSDGRWSSASPSARHRFACARPRSETSRDVADWIDELGTEWRVTSRDGPWKEGGRACLDEFGAEGLVFSVPVNGLMNGRARLANAPGGDVWINYNDIKDEGRWIINQRPVANAGADRVVECNGHEATPVQLDASLSTDPEGDPLTFEWQGAFGTALGAQPTVPLSLGTHVIRMIADDGYAGVRVDEVVVSVVDTAPPEIRAAAANPSAPWPPNHTWVPTTIAVDAVDLCDPTPTCRIVSVTSSEPADGRGDGHTPVDWYVTGPLTVDLRAERSGSGVGRVYTITVECADATGNAARVDAAAVVSHDRRGP